jgi:hypothetical protein
LITSRCRRWDCTIFLLKKMMTFDIPIIYEQTPVAILNLLIFLSISLSFIYF